MLFAVHISDMVLTWPWLVGGFAGVAGLLALSAWRLRDEEIPRIAVLSAAFFVSSSIHIRVPPASIHLLLTGLVGVVLGPRAPLAIFAGTLLQAALLGHGGYSTLGVNTCIMSAAALLCYVLFRCMQHVVFFRKPLGRALLVGVGAFVWFMTAAFGIKLIFSTSVTRFNPEVLVTAGMWMLNPVLLSGAVLFAVVASAVERRLEHGPEFALGFLVGEISVLLTVGLDCAVLLAGGQEIPAVAVLALMLAHLPFAVVEGLILGVVVTFLVRVKPEMLAGARIPFSACSDESDGALQAPNVNMPKLPASSGETPPQM